MSTNYRSSQLVQRKRKILYFKIVGIILGVGVLIWGASALVNLHAFQIKEIEISESKFSDPKRIEEIVRQEMEGKIFFLFKKSNAALLPSFEITQKIKAESSSIKSVDLKVRGFSSLLVKLEEYGPIGAWCSGTECFYINEEGFIFAETDLVFDNNLLKFYGFIQGDPIGQSYSDNKSFSNLLELVKLVEQIGLKVETVSTEDNTTFYFNTKSGAVLLYEKTDDPEEVANNLNTVIEKDAINKAQLGNIEYIDLRFGNKVYYKIR